MFHFMHIWSFAHVLEPPPYGDRIFCGWIKEPVLVSAISFGNN
jgi:hypothetical protein